MAHSPEDNKVHNANDVREEGTELGVEVVKSCSDCGVEMIRSDK